MRFLRFSSEEYLLFCSGGADKIRLKSAAAKADGGRHLPPPVSILTGLIVMGSLSGVIRGADGGAGPAPCRASIGPAAPWRKQGIRRRKAANPPPESDEPGAESSANFIRNRAAPRPQPARPR